MDSEFWEKQKEERKKRKQLLQFSFDILDSKSEAILAGGDPPMPNAQGSYEVWKRGGGQHTRTHVTTGAVCTETMRASQCFL